MRDESEDIRQDMWHHNDHVDGNALGAMFTDLFGREVTAGHAGCGACGSVSLLGALVAYTQAPGNILRCPGCGEVLFVVVRMPNGYRVTFDQLRSLQLPEI